MRALSVPHVNRLLHVEPERRTVAEELPDPVCHVGAHRSSSLANLVNGPAPDTDKIRHLSLSDLPVEIEAPSEEFIESFGIFERCDPLTDEEQEELRALEEQIP